MAIHWLACLAGSSGVALAVVIAQVHSTPSPTAAPPTRIRPPTILPPAPGSIRSLPDSDHPPAAPIPEPSSILLSAGGALVVGLAVALEARRRRAQGARSHRSFRSSWPRLTRTQSAAPPTRPGVAEASDASTAGTGRARSRAPLKIGCVAAAVAAQAATGGCGASPGTSADRAAAPAAADVAAVEPSVDCDADDSKRVCGELSPGCVKLEWIPRPHPDLAGFKVHWGSAPGRYPYTRDVGMNSRCAIRSLSPGLYYFSITAYDRNGRETPFSNEVMKKVE